MNQKHTRLLKGLLFVSIFAVLFCLLTTQSFAKQKKDAERQAIRTPIEKENRPYVEAPQFVGQDELFWISVRIGEELHPMTVSQYVEWVDVYVNSEKIFRMQMTPFMPEPYFRFPLKIKEDSILRVESHSSKYGTWGREVTVQVKSE